MCVRPGILRACRRMAVPMLPLLPARMMRMVGGGGEDELVRVLLGWV